MINNFGDNIDLILTKDRQRDSEEKDLKYILHWNEAYGGKEYDIGFGREPFYSSLCPETRCVTTEDRFSIRYLPFQTMLLINNHQIKNT